MDGVRNNAYCTAVGKVLLAFCSPAVLHVVVASGLAARTPVTISDPEQLRASCSACAPTGWTSTARSANGALLAWPRPFSARRLTGLVPSRSPGLPERFLSMGWRPPSGARPRRSPGPCASGSG
ncbi:MAG: hypothetical protein JOY78_17805 [Pseudonocardia sp.]|nr:hypothetical protein [Pseudonocardia sp.]